MQSNLLNYPLTWTWPKHGFYHKQKQCWVEKEKKV